MKIVSAQFSNRVLVKQDEAAKTDGEIYIPPSLLEKPLSGVVYSVSENYLCPKNGIVTPTVKNKDRVLYKNGTGSPMTIEGTEYIMLMESDIFVVL